ncbi:MAG TPA: NBR1-Ig-like domain-containing protein [Anaerolineales bacterium]|nr:NBR1-Ig-like domain-containing protein [Anaerolineales bacterium]
MSKMIRPVSILFIIIFIVTACNLPSNAPATEEPNAVFTAAALTVQALSTQASPTSSLLTPFVTPTLPPPAATNTSVSFPTLALPTSTRASSPTPVCDQAQFVRDVSIPDGSIFAPNATFTKTWRLRNAGTCTWSGYSLVFDSGDSMSGTSPSPIGTVSPGQEIDVSVNLTAPASAGSYRGHWRIRNSSGVLIPVLGGTQGKSFFVDIKVAVTSSGLDFHTRAPDASWVGSAGVVTFGGPDTNADGFAMFRNNQRLEDGSSPGKVLEIHPQFVNNGVMTGLYPSYTVVAGEHFRARIGFLSKADGTCGVGNAKFQLNYKEAGVIKPLGEWTETCDGTLRDIDVDLSSIAGKNVQFALAVLANGPADDDSAAWVSPRVQLP